MTKLEKLIQEFCPDGVEFRPLEQCCNILDRKRKPVTKSSREAGKYPYYGANGIQDYVSDYIFDGTFILVGEDGSVITDRGTPVVTWASGKIWVNNHAHIIEGNGTVLLRFLYHYIQTIDVSPLIHGNIPKLTGGDFRALTIPVPPIEVQREIVRILDTFTELTSELTENLSKELTARKQQYSYYRDKMLTFANGVKQMTIADICRKVVSGGTPPVGNSDYYGGSIPWLRTQEVDWKDITDTAIKITDEGLKNSSAKWIPANCVIVAMYGATAAKVAINKIPLTTNQACCNLEIDSDIALYRYVFHWLCKEYLSLKGLGQGSQSNINAQTVKQYKIPIPPLPVQQRIVTVLDNFDAICSNLNIGLPAEIEARKKQYEFYRDQLLTFAVQDEIVLTDRQTDRQTSITR